MDLSGEKLLNPPSYISFTPPSTSRAPDLFYKDRINKSQTQTFLLIIQIIVKTHIYISNLLTRATYSFILILVFNLDQIILVRGTDTGSKKKRGLKECWRGEGGGDNKDIKVRENARV